MASEPEVVICTYRVRQGSEAPFLELVERHWPTLNELGLVVGEPSRIFRSKGPGAPTFVEIFTWRDDEAMGAAHQHPAVAAIWEPMAALCEARDGRPAMEFPHFHPVVPHPA